MELLPPERIIPDMVFEHVVLIFQVHLKQGSTCKPVIVKSYVCIFVSMSVKAVHLELVFDLSTELFISCLRRFIARRGKPSSIHSDYGTNFIGACRVLKELYAFLLSKETEETICNFCSTQNNNWHFIPKCSPFLGGLWEVAEKSFKTHLRRVVGNYKIDFEEMSTVLAQVEAFLNSRPLGTVPCNDEEGMEMLTPGHFLLGIRYKPYQIITILVLLIFSGWYLCQGLVRHFWERWKNEYVVVL